MLKRSALLPTMALALIAIVTALPVPAQAASSAPASAAAPVSAQAATAFDVGLIPFTRACPIGSERITIRMDDEDDDNNNSHSGFNGAIISNSNTDLFFCRVDGRSLRAFQPSGSGTKIYPYAVLKLNTTCPNDSVEFTRRFDNEDEGNNNSHQGQIFPNVSDSNTTLKFCLFHLGRTMTSFPSYGFGYGVFSSDLGHTQRGFIYTDDEDDSNNNSYVVDSAHREVAQRIISAGSNTTLRMTSTR